MLDQTLLPMFDENLACLVLNQAADPQIVPGELLLFLLGWLLAALSGLLFFIPVCLLASLSLRFLLQFPSSALPLVSFSYVFIIFVSSRFLVFDFFFALVGIELGLVLGFLFLVHHTEHGLKVRLFFGKSCLLTLYR